MGSKITSDSAPHPVGQGERRMTSIAAFLVLQDGTAAGIHHAVPRVSHFHLGLHRMAADSIVDAEARRK